MQKFLLIVMMLVIKGEKMNLFKRFAFTLNEVMIVLAVLGIVAALTMPTLNANIQSRKWSATSQDFVRELEESLKIMNLKKVLAGYITTKDFVNKLSEYIRIVKICNNDELQNCFVDKVMWGGGQATPEEVDMTKVKLSKHFGLDDWHTELIGVEFANGVTGLVAYNPKCVQEPLSNEPPLTDCLSILYDTSGFSFPNTSGKDLRNYGVINSLGGATCAFEIGGTCYSVAAFPPDGLSYSECSEIKTSLGINECCPDDFCRNGDRWAGAVKACGGVSNLPSEGQLVELAKYLYNADNITPYNTTSDVTLDTLKAAELGFPTDGFVIWSNEEYGHYDASYRTFWAELTNKGESVGRDATDVSAICVGN